MQHAKGVYSCPNNNYTANDNDVLGVLDASGGLAKEDLKESYCAIDPTERAKMTFNKPLLEEATKAFVDKIYRLAKARSDIMEGALPAVAPGELIEKIDAEISARLAKLYLGAKDLKTWDGTLDVRGIDKGDTAGVGASIGLLKINKAKGFCLQSGARIAPESKPFPKGIVPLPDASTDCSGGDLLYGDRKSVV